MSDGFENRPVQRQTFAFQPPAPVQSRAAPSGQSRGVQVQGGNSVSGMNPAGPQTNPGAIAGGLGEYFGELMRPFVERKQREKIFEGFTAAQSGIALDELTHNGSPLTKLFGPTGFEQGAQFYTAKTKISEWSTAQMEDMDRLKRLDPKALAAELAHASEGAMTGDPYADDIIQSGLIEASGPLMNTVAKERFAWQQTEVIGAMTRSSTASANALQGIMTQQVGYGKRGVVSSIVPKVSGNIDIHNRPVVKNEDGTVSTVRSISIGTDEGEVLIPTVADDGTLLDDAAATELYKKTGKHLGIFANADEATSYAQSLHDQQANEYADSTAMQGALNQFLGGMAKPMGMTDDSYKLYLKSFMKGALQDGNFYAYSAMERAGVMKVLPEEDQIKLEDAALKYGNRALGQASKAPDILDRLINLDYKVAWGDTTSNEAAIELLSINQLIKSRTGIENLDLFDTEDIRGAAGSVTNALVAAFHRLEARKWAVEDRNAANKLQQDRWDAEDARDAAKDADVIAQVHTFWGTGNVVAALNAGLPRADFETLAANDYEGGNLDNITKAYQTDGFVSSMVQSRMKAKVDTAIQGETYSTGMQAAYQEWLDIRAKSPAAAKAYYGVYDTSFTRMDSLIRGGSKPTPAYIRAFGDAAIHGDADIPKARQAETKQAVDAYVNSQGFRLYNPISWGNYSSSPNASSRAVISSAVSRQVGIAAKNSDLPTNVLVKDAIEYARKNNTLETYGAFAWTNKPGTKPLHQEFGLQPGEMATWFTKIVDYDLKKAGFADGADADYYEIVRAKGPQGHPVFLVTGKDADDPSKSREIIITYDRIKGTLDREIPNGRKPKPTTRRSVGKGT